MTPEARAELLRVCEEATPGPWWVEQINSITPWTNALSIAYEHGGHHIAHTTRGFEGDENGNDAPSWKNARFIAAAREAVPDLLAENERLREALKPFVQDPIHDDDNLVRTIRCTTGNLRRVAEALAGTPADEPTQERKP